MTGQALSNSNQNYERGVIQITFRRRFFQKLNLAKDRRRYKILRQKTHKRILPFETEYRPSVPNLNNVPMTKRHLIKNQPVLREIFRPSNPFVQKQAEPNFELKVSDNTNGSMGVVFGLSIL